MATFTNQAFLSYRNNVTPSNIVMGEIRDVLSVTKTAVVEAYSAGDTVTYVISISNAGGTTATDLTVTDDLGAYTFNTGTIVPLDYVDGSVRYFVNGALQPAPAVQDAAPLAITGINIPAGGNAIIIYETRVNEFAPLGTDGTINNTATVTGAGVATPVEATETVSATTDAFLTISKAINPVSVVDNEPLTYTFLVQNFGNTATTADDDVVITDTFNPILNPITVTLDGVTLTEDADYTYDETTGTFATMADRVTIPAATYTQDPASGRWNITPGSVTLTVVGTV